ncbi:hypothetical protein ZEAMMB73_Zm00001d034772 [Zea mays]|uniref:Uncharacterized protein n=1 Tax=Zea mays TaxID=4577 RepID=A0A1D6LB69_MAIZE|nr:hypothetical protein ZEAMMB73_Zm00001d034772 [Zea mays]ONM11251.1 hypothetical protein ZEAMMB73_Zm00001d034772 [Zea mays]ONM11257.1 hypothetical protein ZEAMMB73_Zm00001d034772 [Zea mays]ONM11263.1 hypothetical protein ZEAMMB73_Zm00001d034772 [Zea mays]ONM11264.1 hypothetical protein ZEAMMB73_Zm00001d034772 [Zea mays]
MVSNHHYFLVFCIIYSLIFFFYLNSNRDFQIQVENGKKFIYLEEKHEHKLATCSTEYLLIYFSFFHAHNILFTHFCLRYRLFIAI